MYMIDYLFYLSKIIYYLIIHLIRSFFELISNLLFKLLPTTPLYKKRSNNSSNNDFKVFIPGVFGYPIQELKYIPYWNTIRYYGYYDSVLTPKVSPINNFTDRACELFSSINGTELKYIRRKLDHSNIISEPLERITNINESDYEFIKIMDREKPEALFDTKDMWLYGTLPNNKKINFITHSNGAFTLIRLFDLLDKGYFDTEDKKYSQTWNLNIGKIIFISGGLYGIFDNYVNLFKLDSVLDIIKFIIIYIGYYLIIFLQLVIPLSIRKYLYDPLLDIYFNTNSTLEILTNPNDLIKKTQIYEVGNNFPIDKSRVLDILDKTNTKIYSIITFNSENINNIQLLKSDANPILYPISLIFSLTNKVKNKHDGIVPIKSMLGCKDITVDDKSLFLNIIPDLEVTKRFGNRLNIQGYLVDHLSVIGFGDNIYTDKIVWNNITDILNDEF
jgi:hypothetical protein